MSAPEGVVSLNQAVLVVRRHLVLILLSVLVVGAASVGFYSVTPASYESSATVRVFPLPADLRSPTVNQKDISMATEVGIVTTASVASVAATELGWTQSPDLLVKKVSVTNPTDSFLLDISYTDKTAKGAAAGANAFASAYLEQRQALADAAAKTVTTSITTQIDALNKSINSLNTQIQAASGEARILLVRKRDAALSQAQTLGAVLSEVALLNLTPGALVGPATAPDSKSAPKLFTYLGAGILVGLLLGLALATLRENRDDRLHADDDVEELTGLPVLGRVVEVVAQGGSQGMELPATVPDAYRQLAIRVLTRAPQGRPLVCLVAGTGAPGAGTVPAMLAQSYAAEGSLVALASVDGGLLASRPSLPVGNVRLGPEEQLLRRLHDPEPLPEITRGDFEVVVVDAVNLRLESSCLALAHAAQGVVVSVVEGRTLRTDLLDELREMTRSATPVLGLVVVSPAGRRRKPSRPARSDEPTPSPRGSGRAADEPRRPPVSVGRP